MSTDLPGTTRDLVVGGRGHPRYSGETGGYGGASRRGEGLIRGTTRDRAQAFKAMADADLTLVVVDLSTALGQSDLDLIARASSQGRSLLVGNTGARPATRRRGAQARPRGLRFDRRRGLSGQLRAAIAPECDRETGFIISSLRHEQLLRESLHYLEKAEAAVPERIPHEMLLLDLYGALIPIDAITGATTADDILNRIFSAFCIGK